VRIAQHRADGRFDLAPIVALLDEGIQKSEAVGYLAWIVDLLALKALALQAEGHQEALSVLSQAIARGEPERYTRTIIQHGAPMVEMLRRLAARDSNERSGAERLLREWQRVAVPSQSAGAAGARAGQTGLIEPLSEREMEVLRLLAGPLSSTKMAAELIVSPNTVRTHIKSIYDKLGVHDRAHAVARAKDLKLL